MRRVIATIVVLAATVAWPATSARVSAECITNGESPKKRLGIYPVVFVGDVLGFESSDQREFLAYRVRFRIIEAFRGIDMGEQVLQFRQTAESFPFAASQRVLVYAHGTLDDYSTQCTATRVVASDDREVLELRRLSRRPPSTRKSRSRI
jgi:hypothetical protein